MPWSETRHHEAADLRVCQSRRIRVPLNPPRFPEVELKRRLAPHSSNPKRSKPAPSPVAGPLCTVSLAHYPPLRILVSCFRIMLLLLLPGSPSIVASDGLQHGSTHWRANLQSPAPTLSFHAAIATPLLGLISNRICGPVVSSYYRLSYLPPRRPPRRQLHASLFFSLAPGLKLFQAVKPMCSLSSELSLSPPRIVRTLSNLSVSRLLYDVLRLTCRLACPYPNLLQWLTVPRFTQFWLPSLSG